MSPSAKPLAGLKVLELARILAGPWAGQLLADLGADVVKVERAGVGDDTRRWGPPFVETADGQAGAAGYFHSTNRGKRSVQADFDTPEGLDFVRTLAAHADVVIENFKVGDLAKRGLGYEDLKAINPGLIYCSITGFGQTGPSASEPGYDFLIQGLAGAMNLTGDPAGLPMKTGYPAADLFTGLYSVVGVLAALRAREATGQGAHIDMALLDSQVAVLGYQAINYFISGNAPHRMGNSHPTIVPYDVFPTSDGAVIVAVGNDGQFGRFCEALGLPELALDPMFAGNPDRVRNRGDIMSRLSLATARFTSVELVAKLNALKVPVGPVNNMAEVFEHPQVIHRGMRHDLADPQAAGGSAPGLRSPIVIDGEGQMATRTPPRLGEHDDDVRADQGWIGG
jgi:crotonobetainyl-CoA:carnitine CoA-transferase CaiB-like acyl-CoA transferase